jgi:ATP-binding cassette, subfamily G (WHITE), member 2, SNQ2
MGCPASNTERHSLIFLPGSLGLNILLTLVLEMRYPSNVAVLKQFIRGVSGGEKKRVSIAETMVTRGAVGCWDNSTRGLDASTALEYCRSLRVLTNLAKVSTIVTIYQAGEGLYEVTPLISLLTIAFR